MCPSTDLCIVQICKDVVAYACITCTRTNVQFGSAISYSLHDVDCRAYVYVYMLIHARGANVI